MIFQQAAAREFKDITENSPRWRSILKFTSTLANEVRLLREGKDPALGTPDTLSSPQVQEVDSQEITALLLWSEDWSKHRRTVS